MRADSVDLGISSDCAACVKLPARATATKSAMSSSISMIVPLNEQYFPFYCALFLRKGNILSVPSYICIKDSEMSAFGARNAVLLLIDFRAGAMSWAGSI